MPYLSGVYFDVGRRGRRGRLGGCWIKLLSNKLYNCDFPRVVCLSRRAAFEVVRLRIPQRCSTWFLRSSPTTYWLFLAGRNERHCRKSANLSPTSLSTPNTIGDGCVSNSTSSICYTCQNTSKLRRYVHHQGRCKDRPKRLCRHRHSRFVASLQPQHEW